MSICVKLSPFMVQQRLAQHCKSTLLNIKMWKITPKTPICSFPTPFSLSSLFSLFQTHTTRNLENGTTRFVSRFIWVNNLFFKKKNSILYLKLFPMTRKVTTSDSLPSEIGIRLCFTFSCTNLHIMLKVKKKEHVQPTGLSQWTFMLSSQVKKQDI